MRRKRKTDPVLGQFSETIATHYGKADRIVLDTGRQKGKYRIVADLKRKLCPKCKAVHYSSLPEDTCLGCTQILKEENRLGRKMTRREKIEFLKKIGF